MASSLCDRCGQSTLEGMFTIWHGRMVRVGKDCHAAIQREKGPGGLGAVSTPGRLQRDTSSRSPYAGKVGRSD